MSTVSTDPGKGKQLFNQLSCTACHSMREEGSPLVSDLTLTGSKLQEKWLTQFLIAPQVFRGEENIMPEYFYELSFDKKSFSEKLPNAISGVRWISDFLLSSKDDTLEDYYNEFLETNPGISAQQGKMIFESQNCAACHRSTTTVKTTRTAPELALESSRVKKDWFYNFIKKPHAIRPFGYPAGSGSRMPDFRLTKKEIDQMMIFFYNKDEEDEKVPKSSVFKHAKTGKILKSKLSCTGCYQIGENGGKIGPDLTQVPIRLQPSYVRSILDNPHGLDEKNSMPPIQLSADRKRGIMGINVSKRIFISYGMLTI